LFLSSKRSLSILSRLFWSDWETKGIHSVDKETGKDVETIAQGLDRPTEFAVFRSAPPGQCYTQAFGLTSSRFPSTRLAIRKHCSAKTTACYWKFKLFVCAEFKLSFQPTSLVVPYKPLTRYFAAFYFCAWPLPARFLIFWTMILFSVDTRIRCPDPGNPRNGDRHPSPEEEDYYPQGTVIRYTCFPQFNIHGPVARTCMGDGKWSDKAPECLGKCTLIKSSRAQVWNKQSPIDTISITNSLTTNARFLRAKNQCVAVQPTWVSLIENKGEQSYCFSGQFD